LFVFSAKRVRIKFNRDNDKIWGKTQRETDRQMEKGRDGKIKKYRNRQMEKQIIEVMHEWRNREMERWRKRRNGEIDE